MSDFVGIDYNKLPKPEIIENLSLTAIKDQIKTEFIKLYPNYTADLESDLGLALVEVIAYLQLRNISRMNYDVSQAFAALATGANLDIEAANWGVKRQIIEIKKDDLGNDFIIYEDDDSLRRRRLLAPEAITTAGSRGAYLYHIYTAGEKPLTIDYQYSNDNKLLAIYDMPKNGNANIIKHANVITPAPGIVHFSFITKYQNSKPNDSLRDAVLNSLLRGDVKPLTDKVEYVEPIAINYVLDINIYLKDGATGEIIKEKISKNLEVYTEECRRLGALVDLAGVHAACKLGDVADVDCGFTDIQAGWNEYPRCNNISLNIIEPQYNRPAWQNNWSGGNNV